MLLSIVLFTTSTPFGDIFFIVAGFVFLQHDTIAESEIKEKNFPICSQFQNDIRKRFCGCKWFYMKYYFENGLISLHHIQAMGQKRNIRHNSKCKKLIKNNPI